MTPSPTPLLERALPSSTGPLGEVPLSDAEHERNNELVRYLRALGRKEHKRAGKAQLRQQRHDRIRTHRRHAADQREQHYHQRALNARRKVTNPDRRLTSAWRAYTGFSLGAALVSLAAIVWCSITVGRALNAGIAGYMVEGLFSVLLLISLGTQVYATRHSQPVRGWQYVLDAGLLTASLVLNIVPWGMHTRWSQLAELPAHALPPLALVASVAMQYVLSQTFGAILTTAHHETTTRPDHTPDQRHAEPDQVPDHPDHGRDAPDQVETSVPDHGHNKPDHEADTPAPERDTDSPTDTTAPSWSGSPTTMPDHGHDDPDHPDHQALRLPDQHAPDSAKPQGTGWSGSPTSTGEHGPTSSPHSPRTEHTVPARAGAPTGSRPDSSTTPTTVVEAVPPIDSTTSPTMVGHTAETESEMASLATRGMSRADIAELLIPVADALIAEDDMLSRSDITTLTEVSSSDTAGKILQTIKERYSSPPDPTGRRKPERIHTINRAVADITGNRHLHAVSTHA